MAEEKIKSLLHFESKDFYVEFFRVFGGRTEKSKTEICISRPLEDGGFSDQNAFVIHRNGNGTILSSKSCNSIRANQYLIPVFDETDNACFLSIKFITANETDESTVSISVVGLDGNVLKVLVDKARIVNDDKLISVVTDFITNELHIYWDRGIDLGFNMCE